MNEWHRVVLPVYPDWFYRLWGSVLSGLLTLGLSLAILSALVRRFPALKRWLDGPGS